MDLSNITTGGKALYLAYDHGIEHGPSDLPGKSIDPDYILRIAIDGGIALWFCKKEWLKSIISPIKIKFR